MRKIFLPVALLVIGAAAFIPASASAQFDPATCVVAVGFLSPEPIELDKREDIVKFSYQATTNCTNRSNMSFIVRASSNNFATDYYTARKVSIPSSAWVKVPNSDFYSVNAAFTYALFSNSSSDSLGVRGCVQNRNETPDCEATGTVVKLKSATPPGGGTGTGTGSGGTTDPAPNYDQVIGNFENPLKANSIPELLVRLMRILLGLIAAVAVVVIIVSGFRMVLSQGNPVALTKAKSAITWAILGLIVALMAFSIIAILQRLIETK